MGVTLYITLVLVFCLLIAFAYFIVAIKSINTIERTNDFFISNERLSAGAVFATLYAAEMSVATVFIAFFQLAPLLGYILIASIFTFALGQTVLWTIIPKIRESAPGAMTMAGFVGQRFDSSALRKVIAYTSILGFVGLFVTEIVVGARVISAVVGNEQIYWPCVAAIFIFIVFYTLMGGFRNVVATDKIQVALVLGSVFIIALLAISLGSKSPDEPLINSELPKFSSIGFTFFLSLVVINILYPLVDIAAWQRISAAKSTEAARSGFFIGILIFIFTWSAILFAALALSENSGLDNVGGLATSFSNWASSGVLQTIASALGVSFLMAALLSAGDIFLIVAAQAWTLDIKRNISSDEALQNISLSSARRSVLLMAVFGVLLVAFVTSIGFKVADLVFVVYGSTVALLPAVLIAMYKKQISYKLKVASIISICVGVIYGWVYGVLAIKSQDGGVFERLFSAVNFIPGFATSYNAPIAAVVSSVVLLIVLTPLIPNKKL